MLFGSCGGLDFGAELAPLADELGEVEFFEGRGGDEFEEALEQCDLKVGGDGVCGGHAAAPGLGTKERRVQCSEMGSTG